MEELVWRKGEERCIRSYRTVDVPAAQPVARPVMQTEKKALHNELRYALGLNTGQGAGDVAGGIVGDATPQLNKREEASAKMNERYLVGQSTQNPFMPNSNYVSDLEAQMNFLSPR